MYDGYYNTLAPLPLKCYSIHRTRPYTHSCSFSCPAHQTKCTPLTAKALVASGFQGVLSFPSYQIRSSKFPECVGVDTMCAVGANGCIIRFRDAPM